MVQVLLSRLPPSLSLAFAAAVLLAPTLILGALPSHSSPHNWTWALQFSEQFRAGILYPRWMPDSLEGLGGPAFYFYPPLPFWLDGMLSFATGAGAVLHRLGVAAALLFWGSGFAMYLWLKSEAVDRRAALLGAIGYMAAPYHLMDHYIRGAFAETTAYTMLPLVVLGLKRAVAGESRGDIVLLPIAYAALLLSHLPTALLITWVVVPAYLLFLVWRLSRRRAIGAVVRCGLGGALGLGLAAVYLVPASLLQGAISFERLWTHAYSVPTWFLLTPWRWIPPHYIMAMVVSACATWGFASVGALVLSRALRRAGGADEDRRRAIVFWALVAMATIVLMSGLLPWFWTGVPLVDKVQFPWRLLIVTEFAALTALSHLPWTKNTPLSRLLFMAAIASTLPAVANLVVGIPQRAYLALTDQGEPPKDVKEYLPAGYPQRDKAAYDDLSLGPVEALPLISCQPSAATCRAEAGRFGDVRIDVDSAASTTVVLRRFYFPSWKLEPDLSLAASDPLRLVSFQAPAGHTTALLHRVALPQERRGWLLSALSLGLLALWAGWKRGR